MEISYISALISALAMAGVYLTDMAMAGKTYTRPSQPMLVSSVFSAVPGLVLWFLFNQESSNVLPVEARWMAFGAGMVLMLANWFYFLVLYSDAGECTEVACFESASVLVIALVTFGIGRLGVQLHDSISSQQWLGVIIGAGGLLAVHAYGDKLQFVDWRHRLMLVSFMLLGATYEMLIDRAIYLASVSLKDVENPEQVAFLQVSSFFWFGLTTGIVAILPKHERRAWQKNARNLLSYWWAVLTVEGLAILGFAAAVFGFAKGHVAVVALLAGTFPVLVLIGGSDIATEIWIWGRYFPYYPKSVKKTCGYLVDSRRGDTCLIIEDFESKKG